MRSSWRRSWSGEVRCWTSRWPGAASTTRRAVVRIDASRAALRPPVSPSRSNPTSLWPAVMLSRMSAQVPVITSRWTFGHRSRRAARRAGSTYALSDSTAATISVAFTSVDTRARSARSWLVSVTMFRARGSKASPVGVKLAPRAAFRKRAVPTARSSELSVSETVDCETPSDRAARVWPPSWATARKTRRWRSSSSGFTPTSYHRRGRCAPSELWTPEPGHGGSAAHGELAEARGPAGPRCPAGIRRADVGAKEQPRDGGARRRAARRVALEQPTSHPPEAHVDRSHLAPAARPARKRVQGRGGTRARGTRHREARPQRLHRDHSRGGAASRRARHPGHRRTDDQPLRLDHGAHGGESRIRHLGRLRRDRHLRPAGRGRAPLSGGAGARDGTLRSASGVRDDRRHRFRALGHRAPNPVLGHAAMNKPARALTWVLALPAVTLLACKAPAAAPAASIPDVDRKIDPCTDFDAYANGSWRAANPIPAQLTRWGRRAAARETNRRQVKDLLQEISEREDWPRGSIERLLGDHYASCMDEARIEGLGITPVAATLDEIDAIRSRA